MKGLIISESFQKTIEQTYGPIGREWLNNLPTLLLTLEKDWHLKIKEPFSNLSYNFVVSVALAENNFAVLKCGLPGAEFNHEVLALRHFNGQGAVKLLKTNEELGVILLEQVFPGTLLSEIKNETETMRVFTEIIEQLHQPATQSLSLPTVDDWYQGLTKIYKVSKSIVFPLKLADYVCGLGKELLVSMKEKVVLHGDLHQANILRSEDGWLAIDPKGVLGEREYELGAFIRNPIQELIKQRNIKECLSRRLELLAEMTGFDKKRLWAWFFYQAVLAAWWAFEDQNTDWQAFITCAEALKKIKV